MIDMKATTKGKSDQLNADMLMGGQTKTITITRVSNGSKEQPIVINYDGDEGRPYKPCLSMRRMLCHIWGDDGTRYVGRSLTLYCDPSVRFGAEEVGGIRISHASHIEREVTAKLTATKGKRTPFTVKPLVINMGPNLADLLHEIETAINIDELKTIVETASKAFKDAGSRAQIVAAKDKRKAALNANPMEGVK
ncbi:hypothetical protein [Zavarzinella formosa]|uniref:hypothetical protein n=1 Tax=Zavarzinella formosa TaxID=360055 RepID=UPI00030FCBC8|nr:hypothetical protein [Zavarzinella formosa]